MIVAENVKGKPLLNLKNFADKTDMLTSLYVLENKGLGASRQIVIDNAEGDYVIWVDDDFVLQEDFVTKHVEFMDNNPLLGAAAANDDPIPGNIISLFDAYFVDLAKLNSKRMPTGGF